MAAAAIAATRAQQRGKSGPIFDSAGIALPLAEDTLKHGVVGRQVLRCTTKSSISMNQSHEAELSQSLSLSEQELQVLADKIKLKEQKQGEYIPSVSTRVHL